ncbi:hypothetical protein PDJAM_G00093130 [Pangasius djambal]|uniref:Uncharacterized protein n=1 Tax=Pangasius djambal TaxID=1691987 RepID=A0ACC5Z5F0_9TELE|nr:hypothetical protein [Pangasius djambal]
MEVRRWSAWTRDRRDTPSRRCAGTCSDHRTRGKSGERIWTSCGSRKWRTGRNTTSTLRRTRRSSRADTSGCPWTPETRPRFTAGRRVQPDGWILTGVRRTAKKRTARRRKDLPWRTRIVHGRVKETCRQREMKNVHFSIKELYEVNRDNSKRKKRAFPFLRMCKAVEALIFFFFFFFFFF